MFRHETAFAFNSLCMCWSCVCTWLSTWQWHLLHVQRSTTLFHIFMYSCSCHQPLFVESACLVQPCMGCFSRLAPAVYQSLGVPICSLLHRAKGSSCRCSPGGASRYYAFPVRSKAPKRLARVAHYGSPLSWTSVWQRGPQSAHPCAGKASRYAGMVSQSYDAA